jgi:hypothetical protein
MTALRPSVPCTPLYAQLKRDAAVLYLILPAPHPSSNSMCCCSRADVPQLPASRPPRMLHLASYFSRIKLSPTSRPVSSTLARRPTSCWTQRVDSVLKRPTSLTHNHISIFNARTDILRNPPFWLGPFARAQNATTSLVLC